jgi:hypothetical protein
MAMPKYKVTATKDVGYSAIIEAPSKDEAWIIAMGDNPDAEEPDWEQTDDGHDWTLENISEVEDDRECFNCGDTAYPETGFIFQDELYCEDCCPEGYGE